MKNIMVIDGAENGVYDVFAVLDEDFALIFPGNTDVAFVEDIERRPEAEAVFEALGRRGTTESASERPWAFTVSCSTSCTRNASSTRHCATRKLLILTALRFDRAALSPRLAGLWHTRDPQALRTTVTRSDLLQLVEQEFPFLPRPPESEISFHQDACAHCEMSRQGPPLAISTIQLASIRTSAIGVRSLDRVGEGAVSATPRTVERHCSWYIVRCMIRSGTRDRLARRCKSNRINDLSGWPTGKQPVLDIRGDPKARCGVTPKSRCENDLLC